MELECNWLGVLSRLLARAQWVNCSSRITLRETEKLQHRSFAIHASNITIASTKEKFGYILTNAKRYKYKHLLGYRIDKKMNIVILNLS